MKNTDIVNDCPYCGSTKGVDIINSVPAGNRLSDGTYKCECQHCGTHTEDLPFKRDAIEEFFVNSNVKRKVEEVVEQCTIFTALKNLFN